RVTDDDAGRRLDQVLAARIPELSRTRARVLLDIGGVFVDRARVKVASRQVWPGQLVEAQLGGALVRVVEQVGRAARSVGRRALPAPELGRDDDDIVVVHQPAGLLTAPTPESHRCNLVYLLAEGGRDTLFAVHRIDLQTIGLLL